MNASPHRMPGPLFDAVAAGGGGAGAMRLLARAEHSRRLAYTYGVTVAAREEGGGVAEAAEHAWSLFTEVSRAAPEAATAVLTHPSAGPTLIGLLARLRRPDSHRPPPMGWFTALAMSTAVRAGMPARAELPLTGPWVALPSLGRARFPAAARGARAEVRVDSSGRCRITVPGTVAVGSEPVTVPGFPRTGGSWTGPSRPPYGDGPSCTDRWHGARLLAVLDDGSPLLLDTLDPPCFPDAVRRPDGVDDAEARRWALPVREACRILRADHTETYDELGAGPVLLVPLERPVLGTRSGSSAETFGCMALSPPASAAGLAVTLTHEMQHNKLAAMLHLFDLFEPGGPERFYAPWRPDPRPLRGLFHGAYAHLGVARFWERRRETEPDPALRAMAHAEFARWRLAAREATAGTLSSGRLTPLGHRFVGHMLATLDALCRLPVPAPALRRAESAARAHRSAWQRRNGDIPRR